MSSVLEQRVFASIIFIEMIGFKAFVYVNPFLDSQ